MTQRSRVRVPPGPLSSNNLEQVIYTHGAQANSAFHPFVVGKLVAISISLLKIVSRCRRTLRGEGHSAAGWGIGGSVWLQTAVSKVRSFG